MNAGLTCKTPCEVPPRSAWKAAEGGRKRPGHDDRARLRSDVGQTTTSNGAGDTLRSRTEPRQGTEVVIAIRALNRMLELRRPEYVRIA